MQALRANGLSTFYWMPDEKIGKGEIDFVFQDGAARVVPVEVKSGRNVQAKSFNRLVKEGRSNRAFLLSENNFSIAEPVGAARPVFNLPLYAAYCIH